MLPPSLPLPNITELSRLLFPVFVPGLLAVHRYRAVIDQNGIPRIQMAISTAVYGQRFAVNHYVGIAAGREAIVVS